MAGRKSPETHRVHITSEDSDVEYSGHFELAPDGTVRLTELTVTATPGQTISAKDLRRFPMSLAHGLAARTVADLADEPTHTVVAVTRPDGTDRWYEHFAAVFELARSRSNSPAAMIADQSSVPVSAVHRWTREARRRGFLRPDPRGKRTK